MSHFRSRKWPRATAAAGTGRSRSSSQRTPARKRERGETRGSAGGKPDRSAAGATVPHGQDQGGYGR